MQKTVLLGVTSGIAAYKTIDLITLLREEGVNVSVILTKHAAQMVPIEAIEKATENKVFLDLFEKDFDYKDVLRNRKVDHIALADSADLLAIVPATANIIAKLAHGIAEDFLTTTILAVTAPILLAPSMNSNMWKNPIVQENINKLKKYGYQIIEPAEGMLACGYEGKGRLEDIQVIKKAIMDQLNRSNTLQGKRIIVTAGGTNEKIDDIRFITNKSSGKMGVAIAQACFLQGAEVLLLRAKSAIQSRYPIKESTFETAQELSDLLQQKSKTADIVFHTAAVSDFELANPHKGKIVSNQPIILSLTPRSKILNSLKHINPHLKIIAFKAEYGLSEEELITKARKKLEESDADVVVANDVSKPDRGFQVDTNEVIVVTKNATPYPISLASKTKIANDILAYLLSQSLI